MNTRTNHGAIVPIERVEQLKPFTLPTPPPGMKWHREDGWTAEMLPPGKRPFFLGETSVKSNHDNPTDQVGGGKWAWGTLAKGEIATVDCKHLRTARPLLFIHSGHEWTWHRAGDPMPCDGEKQVCLLRTDREEFHNFSVCGNKWDWNDPTIIGWRYADAEKKPKVPLGPEDVPPGSVFRAPEWKPAIYVTPSLVAENGVTWIRKLLAAPSASVEYLSFEMLMAAGWQINRPRHRDQDGNPTLWEACEK